MSDLPWDKQLSHHTTCQANYPFINAFDLRSYFSIEKEKGEYVALRARIIIFGHQMQLVTGESHCQ